MDYSPAFSARPRRSPPPSTAQSQCLPPPSTDDAADTHPCRTSRAPRDPAGRCARVLVRLRSGDDVATTAGPKVLHRAAIRVRYRWRTCGERLCGEARRPMGVPGDNSFTKPQLRPFTRPERLGAQHTTSTRACIWSDGGTSSRRGQSKEEVPAASGRSRDDADARHQPVYCGAMWRLIVEARVNLSYSWLDERGEYHRATQMASRGGL
ncbi:hypothetical protein B0H15DRAFT_947570 [Mycena belliarum]|uniref:Uncharacterized protein n=1 Tax=Mycena belliarum TaxID=1033014 RepID=A0AAD6XR88_9AGAR|nr:hypothetical protein B0H15DRAFT_947570 [Mycena belliae]